ncbi:hypothetical protein HNP46_006504 [Pseudomonas nitritireducens]|uniref:Calcineurin-like phosphoesterase domain-containing protein n=1 Tax=Pseudomonas nitroreducens TaxID=46680 RepID=A0A7W7P5E0_PSENT|nr:metallophosphoesterase [Pseudomonas nitritireducens]MBB4867590.1 hypothetical protein [Pseudomonas nitritireducens]
MRKLYLHTDPQWMRANVHPIVNLDFPTSELTSTWTMGWNGRLHQVEHPAAAISTLFHVLRHRMEKGITTAVNAALFEDDPSLLLDLAAEFCYSVAFVATPGTFLPAFLANIPSLKAERFLQAMSEAPVDLTSSYRRIMIIGDVQGCAAPLETILGTRLDPHTLYILVGDLFDRGPLNGRVLQIIRELLKLPNAILICGNHELLLMKWAAGKATYKEFEERTLPQLLAEGFTKDEAREIVLKSLDLFQFRFHGNSWQVCHGGLPGFADPQLVTGADCWRGIGSYEDDIDSVFERNCHGKQYQAHGHRNDICRDLLPNQRSFSLEEGVEYGGPLRYLVLDAHGIHTGLVTNEVYVPMAHRELKWHKVIPDWIKGRADQNQDHRNPIVNEHRRPPVEIPGYPPAIYTVSQCGTYGTQAATGAVVCMVHAPGHGPENVESSLSAGLAYDPYTHELVVMGQADLHAFKQGRTATEFRRLTRFLRDRELCVIYSHLGGDSLTLTGLRRQSLKVEYLDDVAAEEFKQLGYVPLEIPISF